MDSIKQIGYGMGLLDALYNDAVDYPHGGFAVAAQRVDKPPRTLELELRGHPSHKLGAVTMLKLLRVLRSPRAQAAVSAETGLLLLDLPDIDDAAGCLARGLGVMHKELAEFLTEASAILGGPVTDNAQRRLEKEAFEHIASALQIIRLIRAQNLAGKPEHIRAELAGAAS